MKRVLVAAIMAAGTAMGVTKVQLWFDTEDYTWNRSSDAIRDIANILKDEGIKGNFNIAGYLGRFMVQNRRWDTIEALRHHNIGIQTLRHSYHPTICEYTDIEDYEEAYKKCLQEESEGVGMLKAAYGLDKIMFGVAPGTSSSYVGLDVWSDLGLPAAAGYGAFDDLKEGHFHYQNSHHFLYNMHSLSLESMLPARTNTVDLTRQLDKMAKFDHAILYMHPCKAVREIFWDVENFCGKNMVEFGKWNPRHEIPKEETEQFYVNLRAFLKRVKADGRFEFTDCAAMLAKDKPRVNITMKDIPLIRKTLEKDFGPLRGTPSWSVADCFQAAVRLLRGEKEYVPGKVYGFLTKPEGVKAPVKVKAADLRAAAKGIVFKRHLATTYDVGGTKIGAADFLFAALEVLDTGAEEVTVTPREQLGNLERQMPKLAKFRHPGTWVIFDPKFEDRYLADRLRWQYWTMRWE